MLNQLNINQYMYDVYGEYLDNTFNNMMNYSKLNSLIIKYFKVAVNESMNYDSETSIQITAKKSKYFIYDFTPVLDSQPFVYTTSYDDSTRGTSTIIQSTMSIYTIKNPVPGDMFYFYLPSGESSNDQQTTLDSNEVFRVKHVNYIRNINNKFKLYQLDFESAPFKKESLDEIERNNCVTHYFFNNEIDDYVSEDKMGIYMDLLNNKESYITSLKKFYNNNENKFLVEYTYTTDDESEESKNIIIGKKLNSLIYLFNGIYKFNNISPVIQSLSSSYNCIYDYTELYENNENFCAFSDFVEGIEGDGFEEISFSGEIVKLSLENNNLPEVYNSLYKLIKGYLSQDNTLCDKEKINKSLFSLKNDLLKYECSSIETMENNDSLFYSVDGAEPETLDSSEIIGYETQDHYLSPQSGYVKI